MADRPRGPRHGLVAVDTRHIHSREPDRETGRARDDVSRTSGDGWPFGEPAAIGLTISERRRLPDANIDAHARSRAGTRRLPSMDRGAYPGQSKVVLGGGAVERFWQAA